MKRLREKEEAKVEQVEQWKTLFRHYRAQNVLTASHYEESVKFGISRAFRKGVSIRSSLLLQMEPFHYPHCLAAIVLIPRLRGVLPKDKCDVKYVCRGKTGEDYETNRIDTFYVARADVLNEILYSHLDTKEYGDADGLVNSDLTNGPLKGGKIYCVVDDKREAIVSYSWNDQACTVKMFLRKTMYREENGKVTETDVI
jgi:hypothetical protein